MLNCLLHHGAKPRRGGASPGGLGDCSSRPSWPAEQSGVQRSSVLQGWLGQSQEGSASGGANSTARNGNGTGTCHERQVNFFAHFEGTSANRKHESHHLSLFDNSPRHLSADFGLNNANEVNSTTRVIEGDVVTGTSERKVKDKIGVFRFSADRRRFSFETAYSEDGKTWKVWYKGTATRTD